MIDTKVISQQWQRMLAITRKDIRIYYSRGPVVISGILFPVFLFIAFSLGRNLPTDFMMTGLIGMGLFFAATAVSPMVMPFEGQGRTLERLMSCPVKFEVVILGDILASFIYGLAISLILVIITLALGLTISSVLVFAAGLLLATICFAALGNLFSVPPTNMPQTINMIGTVVRFPIVFISGVFTPLEQLSGWGKDLAYISPLTYFTDIARHSIQHQGYFPLGVDLIILAAFSAIFLVLAMELHARVMPKRI